MAVVGMSLPPKVEGPVCGEVEVSLPRIRLLRRRVPRNRGTQAPQVAIRWWGSDSEFVFPSSTGSGGTRTPRAKKRRAWFPVKCSAENLMNYLIDCGSIEFVVRESDNAEVLGKARIVVEDRSKRLRDDHIRIEGTIPVLSEKDEEKVGELEVQIRIGIGENRSMLLQQMENSNVSLTSFEMNELLTETDTDNLLAQAPASPRSEISERIPRALQIVKALREDKASRRSQTLSPKKVQEENASQKGDNLPNKNQAQEVQVQTGIPFRASQAVQTSDILRNSKKEELLNKAMRLRSEMTSSLNVEDEGNVLPLLAEFLVDEKGDWIEKVLEEAQADTTPYGQDTLAMSMQPITAAAAAGLRVAETAKVTINELTFAKQLIGDMKLEATLKLGPEPKEFESAHPVVIFETNVGAHMKQNRAQINSFVSWPIQLSHPSILYQWLHGFLELKLLTPQRQGIGSGNLPLRQVLLAEGLETSARLELTSENHNVVGHALLEFKLLPKEANARKQKVAMRLADVHSVATLPLSRQEDSDASVCIQLLEIHQLEPNSKGIQVKHQSRKQGYLSLTKRDPSIRYYPKTSLPRPFVFEVFDDDSNLIGLAKLPQDYELPFHGEIIVRDLFTGKEPLSITVRVFRGNLQSPHSSPEKEKNVQEMRREKTPPSSPVRSQAGIVQIHQRPASPRSPKKPPPNHQIVERAVSPVPEEKEDFQTQKPATSTMKRVHHHHVFIFEPASSCFRRDIAGSIVSYQFPRKQWPNEKIHEHELWWDSNIQENHTIGRHLIESEQEDDVLEFLEGQGSVELRVLEPSNSKVFARANLPLAEIRDLVAEASSAAQSSSFVSEVEEDTTYRQVGRASRTVKLPLKLTDGQARLNMRLRLRYLRYEETSSRPESQKKRVVAQESALDAARATLIVQIGLISGLQSLARNAAEVHPNLEFLQTAQHAGVNAVVTIDIDVAGAILNYVSDIYARTFQMNLGDEVGVDFSLEPKTLEALGSAIAAVEVWHHEPNFEGKRVLLGEGEISLRDLLLSQSGVSGSFALRPPSDKAEKEHDNAHPTLAHVELAVFFDHHRNIAQILPTHDLSQSTILQLDEVVEEEHERIKIENVQEEEDENEERIVFDPFREEKPELDACQEESKRQVDVPHDTGNQEMQVLVSDGELSLTVLIENAMHLPMVSIDGILTPPSPYVFFTFAKQVKQTGIAGNSPTCMPRWMSMHELKLRDLADLQERTVRFHFWHHFSAEKDYAQSLLSELSESFHVPPGTDYEPFHTGTKDLSDVLSFGTPLQPQDVYIGTAVVDLSTIGLGVDRIHGWYHIIDPEQRRVGQVKVKLNLNDIDPANDDVLSLSTASSDDENQIAGPAPVAPLFIPEDLSLASFELDEIRSAVETLNSVTQTLQDKIRGWDEPITTEPEALPSSPLSQFGVSPEVWPDEEKKEKQGQTEKQRDSPSSESSEDVNVEVVHQVMHDILESIDEAQQQEPEDEGDDEDDEDDDEEDALHWMDPETARIARILRG